MGLVDGGIVLSRSGSMKDLFGDTPFSAPSVDLPYPNSPGHKEWTTSKDAADAIAPTLSERQTEVFDAYKAVGERGLTADEVASKVDRSVLAVRPRVSELGVLGLIERSGERRANESGLKAAVWRIK